jgi:protein SCO1
MVTSVPAPLFRLLPHFPPPNRTHLVIALVLVLSPAGCWPVVAQANASDPAAAVLPATSNAPMPPVFQGTPLDFTNTVRSFLGRGLVQEIPSGGKAVVIRHDEIPGFMPRMTMEFSVRDPKELTGLHPGDAVEFRVKATEEESWIEGLERVNALSESAPPILSASTSAALAHIAQVKPGDPLPDAELIAEDGRPIHFSGFRGRAVAFTFIFTRCPLPDFCPRMSRSFERARELLLARPDAPTNWQFLSISFDPEFDRPEVLRRYAQSYRGDNTDRWLFATASTNSLASLVPELDFRFMRDGGSLVHNLRTVVLDPEGRIYRYFDGKTWKPEDLVQALDEAARLRPGFRGGSGQASRSR